ncbi:MAG: hypothetical protein KAJ63_09620, partial [Methyloprofundus sp.]|nr:hypothetical protein [Methyloprofundus sp.]
VLQEYDDDYLRLYLSLTDVQKDFFDLEKGLRKNRSDRNLDQNIKNFYANISNSDWKILKNGLKIAPYDKQFKSEFPKLFEHSEISKGNLQQRCGTNELQEIITKIRELL